MLGIICLLIFLSSSKDPVAEILPAKTTDDVKEFVVPLELQSGFVLPEGIEDNRFLLAFGNFNCYFTFTISKNPF
jgi:hypothetical protein